MDYLSEARKFMQRATDAEHIEVVRENIKLAHWFLDQEVEARNLSADHAQSAKVKEALNAP